MIPFERTPAPAAYLAIALAIAVVFVSDLYTTVGLAVWLFYLIPVALAYFVWRPLVPAGVALIATILTIVGYYVSPSGTHLAAAWLNRTFGIATSWVLAVIGYHFITGKLAVRKRQWLQLGQTRLSEEMMRDYRAAALAQNILRFLAEFLDAKAGAIFFGDGESFHRLATYGVPQDARVAERFERGDGLLGQAAADNRVFHLRDVPEGYLVAGSSLGRGAPRHLVVVPVGIDGQVKAVLEFGFFNHLTGVETDLLTHVSESIAAAVRSSQHRARLQELLEETQRQAEELQTQSEELRVANEELEEQSRVLKESQGRLELQQVELEQTNSRLEEQTQTLEAQKNELARTAAALQVQRRELELASRYKSEFLANMSHELRTPLNASLILARQLAENRAGNLTAEQIKNAHTIESAGKDLLALINDVLDLSKVEAGRMDVHSQPVQVKRLLDNLTAAFQPLAQQKGLRLQISALEDRLTLETDLQRLEQILKNLLSNAIKYTEQGEVALDVSRAEAGTIAFAVRDTGIGIPADQQQVIFEPFCQADGTTHRKYGGTGLGLSISRQLAHLLGGEIQLSSFVGQGSTFTVLLPERYQAAVGQRSAAEAGTRLLTAAPAAALPPRRPPTASPAPVLPPLFEDDRERLAGGRRVILVVEDDEPFARILYDLAHELEFQALVAASCKEALALAAQYNPSAIVLDIGLPDHSGLMVLDQLKKDARTRHIPVHVVSVHDYTETALSLGAVGYMLKPVRREQLIEAFRRLETRLSESVRRVLIVEDDAAQREALVALLGTGGVEAITAGSAAECLERLSNTVFDCMVLDLNLPDTSGFSLLDKLSREDRYSFPPVIVYTGRELTPDEEQRLRRYSSSIIIKGAKSPERLLDEVTLFLHRVIAELPSEQRAMLEKLHRGDGALEGRHILLVEDDVRNVFALTSVLEPTGAHVQVARNGREALDALERSLQPDGSAVDLVLMDIMMPEMDGLTAMREIRGRTEWKNLPIIALTAKATRNDHEQALTAGANDYMAKPLDIDKLLSLVRVWMPR